MRYNKLFSVMMVLMAGLAEGKASILLSAESFAALGGSTVTNTGPSVLNGNLGLYPGSSVSGFPPGTVNGTSYLGDSVAMQAQLDATAAYNVLLAETPTQDLSGQDLGGFTLTSGVRMFSSSAGLTGTLTLDGQGNANSRFDFQIGTSFLTAGSSSIVLINGAKAENVYWQVGSSATLGTGTVFNGSIVADQSITLNGGTSMFGSALALNGAVNLDNSMITVPEPAAIWLLFLGLGILGIWHWAKGIRNPASAIQ